jgi:amino acid transporter
MHTFTPNAGVGIMNLLVAIKLVILVFITITGFVVLGGDVKSVPDPHASFRDVFAGSVMSGGPYATAMFKVLNSYTGWNNAAYVLNEVKKPVHTLKIAGPLGLSICTLLYMFANIAYFSVATPQEISQSGITVASFFASYPFTILSSKRRH